MSAPISPLPAGAPAIKECCAHLYESQIATWLLGESFHPGGVRLTERLGERMGLSANSRVLDVAAGRGASSLFLAERFGCRVVGVDYSHQSVTEANERAAARGLSERVRFEQADAESLPFEAASFDALICECAFCTFPDKSSAAREFARVLCPGARVGLSDLTRATVLPETLSGLLAWIACIADAQPLNAYIGCLRAAGFDVDAPENHDEALRELVRQVQGRLLAVEVLAGLQRAALPELDLRSAKQMAQAAAAAIERRELGYALITATAPATVILPQHTLTASRAPACTALPQPGPRRTIG